MFDSSNPLLNSSDSVLQLLGEMVALSDDSNLNSVAPVPSRTVTTMDSS